MKTFFIPLCMALSLVLIGCKTSAPIVTTPRNDSVVIRNVYHHDSIYIHDSVFIAMQNDTVVVHKWHTDWRYSIKTNSDTVYLDKEVVVTLPPEKYIPPFYKWCTGILIVLVILLLLYVALRVIIWIYARK